MRWIMYIVMLLMFSSTIYANGCIDTDGDSICDVDDPDDDNDGILDGIDVDPWDPNICTDSDGDGCDDCSIGMDGFGPVPDNDPFNDGVDTDSDGMCDVGDMDDDNDGVEDPDDLNALDPNSCEDSDSDTCDDCSVGIDGFGPVPDNDPFNDGVDTDSDGMCDSGDICPGFDDLLDSDGDGMPDGCDVCPLDNPDDSDQDGICESEDNCPFEFNSDQTDSDGDGKGNICDECPSDNPDDSDGDGTCDSSDSCPGFDDFLDSDGDTIPNGCDNCMSVPNTDQANNDGDAYGNVCEFCPDDPLNDADADGLCANLDNCPSNANPSQVDSDGDSHGDACDNCPTLSNSAQDDADVDNHGDECDNCPCIANSTQLDTDGNNRGDACEVGSAKLFVNEFHYDNENTDVNETVELVATTNLNLTGWKFQLYNGIGGSIYADYPLSGNITAYGFKVIDTPAMQNGAPDGMAIVDPDGKVVQFLSYEGNFTAYDCPAKGLTSSDIGVFESSVPYGHSLQLSGSGALYEDFNWTDAKANTFGAVNTGQSFPEFKAQPQIIMYLLD